MPLIQTAGLLRTWKCRSPFRHIVLFLVVSSTLVGFAQTPEPTKNEPTPPEASGDSKPSDNEASNKKEKEKEKGSRGAFVGVPVPVSSPAIGSGVVLMGGYVFPLRRSDTISAPSTVGAAALFTNNGSRGLVVGTELFFSQDRYHVLTGYVQGNLNYDFYGIGNAAGDAGIKFGLKQTGRVFFGEIMRTVFWRFRVGPRAFLTSSNLASRNAGGPPAGLPPLDVDFTMRSLGFKVERDTRMNHFYPENGTSVEFSADFFDKALGSTFTFQTYRLNFSAYQRLTKNQLFAYDGFLCATGGRAPFFGECIFGTSNRLRGYTAGRYIDRDMAAVQAEYRATLPWRFGVVAFAGVGEVGPTFGSFNYSNLLPSGGIGPRFQLSTKYHVNLRADFAWGKTGRTFSMGLGEAF